VQASDLVPDYLRVVDPSLTSIVTARVKQSGSCRLPLFRGPSLQSPFQEIAWDRIVSQEHTVSFRVDTRAIRGSVRGRPHLPPAGP